MRIISTQQKYRRKNIKYLQARTAQIKLSKYLKGLHDFWEEKIHTSQFRHKSTGEPLEELITMENCLAITM